MIDIHTIGAGGGSIARLDAGGAFRVGPQSAGAMPGPAGYGRGGTLPTVTDANIMLGRLDPENFLGGAMALDVAAAKTVIERFAGEIGLAPDRAALGILTIINANMANAIRSRTVQKGIDPRGYALVAFGGAGPLHAVEVAQTLGIKEVIIPPAPGITSAMGLLTTDLKYDAVRTCFQFSNAPDLKRMTQDFTAMEAEIAAQFTADGLDPVSARYERAGDLRYVGQGYELRVTFDAGAVDKAALAEAFARFHQQHRAEYGHAFTDSVIEIVNLRVTGFGPRPKLGKPPRPEKGGSVEAALVRHSPVVFAGPGGAPIVPPTAFLRRDLLPIGVPIPGPVIVLQTDSTTVVPPGCTLTADIGGNLIIAV
jgi:N-methylhydantoinase A/oxoprolinase/acetone carboxylase beta subunit